ncbi:MAG: hemolysin III family protein [Silvanigrellales bacterium]|jgi:hemolysin III|nr:hemolysin III family protein [Silvanigrellales bacterium]
MPPLSRRALFFQRKKHPRFIRPKSAAEEFANRATHGAGALLALVALVVLVLRSEETGELLRVVSYAAFGVSLVLLYGASFAYHSARAEERRRVLKIADHAAIYLLIAGTYTPFMVNVLGGQAGVTLLVVVWTLAVLGVVFKFYFAHRFKLASTLVYLVMGWLVLFVIGPLTELLSEASVLWLVAGGLSYSTGVVFYLWDRLPFSHAIWHVFVLGGSACHVFALLNATP